MPSPDSQKASTIAAYILTGVLVVAVSIVILAAAIRLAQWIV